MVYSMCISPDRLSELLSPSNVTLSTLLSSTASIHIGSNLGDCQLKHISISFVFLGLIFMLFVFDHNTTPSTVSCSRVHSESLLTEYRVVSSTHLKEGPVVDRVFNIRRNRNITNFIPCGIVPQNSNISERISPTLTLCVLFDMKSEI